MSDPDQKRDRLTATDSQLLTEAAGEDVEILSIERIQDLLGCSAAAARARASRLATDGWLTKLRPGVYLIVPLAAGPASMYTTHEYEIATHIADPMYIGYGSALAYHGLTSVLPHAVTVVTPKRVTDREIHGVTYLVRILTESKFFGADYYPIENNQIPISTVEKTLVDCADHPEFCGGLSVVAEAVRTAARQGCTWSTVTEYLDRLASGAATKRLVYLTDQLGITLPDRSRLVSELTRGYPQLDPTCPPSETRSETYMLSINTSLPVADG